MHLLLIILFAITLIYMSVAERFYTYFLLIAVQGFLLFGIALSELDKINLPNLLFIISETLIFKGIVFPYLLYTTIKRSKINKVHNQSLPVFYSLLFAIAGLLGSILLAWSFKNQEINNLYFSIAIFTAFIGILLITTHKKIFSHLIGFLILENGVFILSFAVGNKMPMLINTAILLDIFVSVLILGMFINRIGDKISDFGAEELKKLVD